MKIFKEQVVNLHRVEKVCILTQTLIISFMAFSSGYWLIAHDVEGEYWKHIITGSVFMLISVANIILVYRTLVGKGINKLK